MKKLISLFMLLLSITLISGCEIDNNESILISLPNLKNVEEIKVEQILTNVNVNYIIIYEESSDIDSGLFIRYGDNLGHGDNVESIKEIRVYISKNNDKYFTARELVYDGPRLDEMYKDIGILEPRGGYFEVTLDQCFDGDTTRFYYPDEVYNAIESGSKTVRYLNIDTQETYSGGEEMWGKPATYYTCNILESAESIILQTDPDDNLLGNYGRLLAWVWVKLPGDSEYELLNYKILQQGLAEVKYLFGAGQIKYDNISYTNWMYKAENFAKENDYGMWGDIDIDPYWDYKNNQPNDNWNYGY